MSLKTEYIEEFFPNIRIPDAKFSPFPTTMTLPRSRRGRSFINNHLRHHLFLNASGLPSDHDQKIIDVKQSINEPSINMPYMQVLKNIDAIEPSINKKIDELEEKGVNQYLTDAIKDSKPSEQNILDYPENVDPVSSGVVAVSEVPVRKPKRKQNAHLPIIEHQARKKPKKR